MRPSSRLLAVVALVASVAAAPAVTTGTDEVAPLPEGCRTVDVRATPEDATDDEVLCTSQLFVRAGDAPVSNAASAVFSPDAPDTAPVGGAGLGGSAPDIALQGDPGHGLEVNGTFTGAADSLVVEAYVAMPNGALGSHGTTPTIAIDGFDGFASGLVETTVTPGTLPGTALATFRVDGLLQLWNALGYSYGTDVEHTLRLNLSPFFIGDDGAYLYDGTEVPSNVVINPAD